MLLRAKSSFSDTYPRQANEIVHHALFQIIGAAGRTMESLEVLKILLDSREGQEAMDVTSTGLVNSTPLAFCIMASSNATDGVTEQNETFLIAMDMLLEAGANVTKTSLHHAPITLACESKCSPEVVSLLLRYGADPNTHEALSGSTCLHLAIKSSQMEKVKILLMGGADLNVMGPNGERPFFTCYQAENVTCSQLIMLHSRFRVNKEDFLNITSEWREVSQPSPEEKFYMYKDTEEEQDVKPPKIKDRMAANLHKLVSDGDIDGLTNYLATCSTSDLNKSKCSGLTALHAATIKNDFELVEVLLQHGADANVTDNAGSTPLIHAAGMTNSLEIIDMLCSKGAHINMRTGSTGKTALFKAAQANKVENAEHLCVVLKADARVGELTTGATPLHLMAQMNNSDNLDIILNASNADILNRFGATPLHYAAKTDAKEAATSLIKKGASLDITCFAMKNSPIHVAAACNSAQVANLLIENDVNHNVRNISEETPLFLAAATGSISVLKILLSTGAEIDARNIYGQTPLYIAVSYEEFEAASILIHHGANIEARDFHRNETILHIATSTGNVDFVKFLLSKGADKEAKDTHGLTPLLRSATTSIGQLMLPLLEQGCNAKATIDSQNRFKHEINVLHLLEHNLNVLTLEDIVYICPRTRKPKLHKSLRALPRDIRERTIGQWKTLYGNHAAYHGKWI